MQKELISNVIDEKADAIGNKENDEMSMNQGTLIKLRSHVIIT